MGRRASEHEAAESNQQHGPYHGIPVVARVELVRPGSCTIHSTWPMPC